MSVAQEPSKNATSALYQLAISSSSAVLMKLFAERAQLRNMARQMCRAKGTKIREAAASTAQSAKYGSDLLWSSAIIPLIVTQIAKLAIQKIAGLAFRSGSRSSVKRPIRLYFMSGDIPSTHLVSAYRQSRR